MNLSGTPQSLLSIMAAAPLFFGKKLITPLKGMVFNKKQLLSEKNENSKPIKLVRYDELQAYRNLNSLF